MKKIQIGDSFAKHYPIIQLKCMWKTNEEVTANIADPMIKSHYIEVYVANGKLTNYVENAAKSITAKLEQILT